jgi:CubicO group peptidase (beta-lactamase class C family)
VIVQLPAGGVIEGGAADGFGPVVDAFVANFRERGEVGAAVAVYRRGEKVVDLWGGLADPRTGRRWTSSTPAVVFSVTKGVLAIGAYVLVEEGRLDLDAPVVRYWPEFGQQGKGAIPVRWLLTHRAGLCALDRSLTRDEVLAWEPVIRAIEGQAPLWPPGTAHAYHGLTYGWLVGEVIRRVTGESVGTFVRRRLAAPLGLRLWVGLPVEERDAVAWLLAPLPDTDPETARANAEALADPVVARGFSMGGAFAFPADGGHVTFNDPDIQAAEVPGANGIADAASLARLYAACVSHVAGVRLMAPASVEDALVERSRGRQRFGGPDQGERWGTGFAISSPPGSPLLGPRSFGHGGAGGELAFADDEHGVAFAYVNNQMGGVPDDRARLLVAALRACLHLDDR